MNYNLTESDLEILIQKSRQTITAKVICDSINPDGVRLTTMEWTYPRMIHSEIMTHRKLSRNSASSRAIPVTKMIQRVIDNPVFPIHFGVNQKGMQASEELTLEQKLKYAELWLQGRDNAVEMAQKAVEIGIHKQIGNRPLETWMWITIIASATNFENLFSLRVHKAAEPHFQNLAGKVMAAYDASTPTHLDWGEWHLPLFGMNGGNIKDDGLESNDRPKVSVGRCARVSYLTHEGKREPQKDIELYEQLAISLPKHASPLEHPAQTIDPTDPKGTEYHTGVGKLGYVKTPISDWGNFDPGWLQFRKMHEGENITTRTLFE